jgi:hypothetical protein
MSPEETLPLLEEFLGKAARLLTVEGPVKITVSSTIRIYAISQGLPTLQGQGRSMSKFGAFT